MAQSYSQREDSATLVDPSNIFKQAFGSASAFVDEKGDGDKILRLYHN